MEGSDGGGKRLLVVDDGSGTAYVDRFAQARAAGAEVLTLPVNRGKGAALKAGLAQMLKGGVIMDVTTPEQARIAEKAGACAVMALER